MDLDKALVSSLLRDGQPALKRAREKGLRPDLLSGDGQIAYQFICEYNLRYGNLPPLDVVAGKTGVVLEPIDPSVHPEFLVDEVFNRKVYEKLRKGYEGFEKQLQENAREPNKILAFVEELLLEMRRDQLTQSKVESIWSLGPEVQAYYEKIKKGERGILTPWNSVNEATLGFWPMDLALFVARVGIGKTWSACMLALEAWKQGKKVLFATTEVSRQRIAMRLFALHYQLPYKEFRTGKLTIYSEPRFYQGVEEMLNKEGFYVVGGNFDFRVESFSAAIDEIRPDFVVLDGAYLLRVQGASRTEKAANAFDELKRLANRHELPMAVTHQFNREVKANVASSVRTESIGLTDVAAWNADLVFALIQTDDMKKDRKMRMKPLKIREGEGDEIEISWNFDMMDFRELGKVSGGGDAEEFDTGAGSSGSPGPIDGAPGDDVPF